MLLPTTSQNQHTLKGHEEFNTYRHLVKHLTTDKDARKLTILLIINLVCAVLEIIYGFLSNSIGLLSDSAHMMFDSTALAVGIYASYKATLPANSKFSYGFDRFQTLSGLINGIFLIFIGFYIFIESLERMYNPPVIQSQKMIVVAVIGLIVNVVGVTFFHEHAHFGDDDGHACSHGHSHGKDEKKAHKHEHKPAAIHSHSHSHSHAHHSHDHHEPASSINQIHDHSLTSLNSTVNSLKEDDHHHDHHDHANCNHDHGSHQPNHHQHDHHDHHHDHKHDHKSHSHDHKAHAHAHSHDHHDHHDHDHDHDHDEHDHDHDHDHHHNENLAGVFLHILADLLGSVGVITSSLLIIYFDWYIADAICSAITSLLILASVIPLIKSSVMVFLQTYPARYRKVFHQALSEISQHPAIVECKDPHLWTYAGGKLVCSLILIVKQHTTDTSSVVEFARKRLKVINSIQYMTIDCRTEGQI